MGQRERGPVGRGPCFLNCDPPAGGGDEAFYVAQVGGTVVYGHTVDAWAWLRFPDEQRVTLAERERGVEFGCWHSKIVPEGEIGSYRLGELKPVSYEGFATARERGWAPSA